MICAGSMTGTSLDGIDVAQITTDGHSISEFGPIFFRPFSNTEKSSLSAAMGKWPEDHNLLVAREIIHKSHLDAFQKFPEAKILGFHGQTQVTRVLKINPGFESPKNQPGRKCSSLPPQLCITGMC